MKRKLSKILGVALTIAVLMSLLVTGTPATALSQPQVAATQLNVTNPAYEISKLNIYTMTFTAGVKLAAGDQIVVTFPAGGPGLGQMVSTGVAADVTLEATTGIGGGPIAAPVNGAYVITGSAVLGYTLTITVPAGSSIGAGSLVGVVIGGVTGVNNPAAPGSYTINVKTQDNTTTPGTPIPLEADVASAPITINAPGITPLPGVVLAYNTAGILMSQSNNIQVGINAVASGGRVEVGPGTYDETIGIAVGTTGLTVVGTGEAGTVIIQDASAAGGAGTLTVSSTASALFPVVIDGFTFSQNVFNAPATPITLPATATYVTITNCAIEVGPGGNGINSIAAGLGVNTVSNCSFDANGTAARIGIAANTQMAITNCTFDIGDGDTGITTAAGTNPVPAGVATTITDCTFTGASGTGITSTAGYAIVSGSTFNTLTTALSLPAAPASTGTLVVKNSTIDGCGGTATIPAQAVVAGAGTLILSDSTVQNTEENNYAFGITAAAVTLNFNNIINAKNINTAVAMTADHNWWGATSGPVLTSFNGVANITYVPYLTASNDDAVVAYNVASILAKDTLGVDVITTTGGGAAPVPAPAVIGISKYTDNPEIVTPTIQGTGEVVGYYDVYMTNGVAGAAGLIQIKFYGPVTQYTKVYYAGGLGGQWATPTISGVNVAGGYAYVTVNAISGVPTFNDMTGLAFAVVEDKILTAPNIATAAGGSPTLGAYDISTSPTFTWAPVLGVDHYEIALCEDPSFTIIEWAYNVDDPFFKADEALRYDTTYYWRVRGVIDAAATAFTPWATGIFTTEAEPVDPADATPVVIDPVKPEVNVEIPPTKITVEPSTPAIPTYMLWIIVVVGAVLVIALIVLIVRTRRVA